MNITEMQTTQSMKLGGELAHTEPGDLPEFSTPVTVILTALCILLLLGVVYAIFRACCPVRRVSSWISNKLQSKKQAGMRNVIRMEGKEVHDSLV